MAQIGVITEQFNYGDTFNPLNEQDQKKFNKDNNESKDNEKKNKK